MILPELMINFFPLQENGLQAFAELRREHGREKIVSRPNIYSRSTGIKKEQLKHQEHAYLIWRIVDQFPHLLYELKAYIQIQDP